MEFYISPQSAQFYMINVLENQWLSVTTKRVVSDAWQEKMQLDGNPLTSFKRLPDKIAQGQNRPDIIAQTKWAIMSDFCINDLPYVWLQMSLIGE